MWSLVKILAIASLLHPLASAAVTESCAEERDETSLAQLHHIVHKRGNAVKTEHLNKEARGPTPMFNDGDAPPISTTNKCIMMLATQYFALYTALAIARTLASFQYNVAGVQSILETGCSTVTYAPMLCVLFLGARMRAIQLSQGQTEKYHLPQPWVQNCMFLASFAVMAQVVLVLIVGFMNGLDNVKTDKEGNLDLSDMEDNGNATAIMVLTLVRYIVMFLLYGGMMAVVYGIFTMDGPKAIWGDETPPVSPAVFCTMLLSGLFFMAYGLVAITQTLFDILPKLREAPGLLLLQNAARSAQMTVNFAPMLCLLFVGARMRALQIDPKHGNPQPWAQDCFYLCTGSIYIQAALVIILPLAAGAECKPGPIQGDVEIVVENKTIGGIVECVRYLCLFALYGGVATIVYSVFVIEAKPPHKTPLVSPMMKCTMILAAQYFFVYTSLFILITVHSFLGANEGIEKGIAIFDAGRATVMFAPMLSCLFMGARMRSLQLAKDTNGNIPSTAGPQPWVQTAMFMSTGAVVVQLIMTMLVPILTGQEKPQLDDDGNVKMPEGGDKSVAKIVEAVRYIMLICMYGGACTVAYGVYAMTPDTVQPYCNH